MTRGRKPTPAALNKQRGNPGKRKRRQSPEPQIAIPDPPAHLAPAALEEWRRIAPELATLGLMTRVDRTALAAYCQTYARWIDAENQITEFGTVVKAPSGYPMQSPYLAIANKALQQMKGFLTEFGMTPVSRARVDSKGPSGDEDPADEFFTGPRLASG